MYAAAGDAGGQAAHGAGGRLRAGRAALPDGRWRTCTGRWPSGWERDVKDTLLREDIAACVDGDPANRLRSAKDVASRLLKLEHRRKERREKAECAAAGRGSAEGGGGIGSAGGTAAAADPRPVGGRGGAGGDRGPVRGAAVATGSRTREAQTNATARNREQRSAGGRGGAAEGDRGGAAGGARCEGCRGAGGGAEAVRRARSRPSWSRTAWRSSRGGTRRWRCRTSCGRWRRSRGRTRARSARTARIAATLNQCVVPWVVTVRERRRRAAGVAGAGVGRAATGGCCGGGTGRGTCG